MPSVGTMFGPAGVWMLGSVLPAWILWIICFMSSGLPLVGSLVPGLWHMTQYCTSTRAPPCAVNMVWQPSQVAVSTISRLKMPVVAPLEGWKVKAPLFAWARPRISKPTRCVNSGL